MKKLSFPTVKLGNFICEVKEKVKNSGISQDDFTVYGVTNTDGITVTNNKASDDLGSYTVLRENQFAYNPYRVNVGSIGLSLPGTFGAVSPAYVVFETNGQISNEFLLYYLKSSLGINLIKWYGDRGGVRSALRFSDLKKIDFPDIPLEQQNKLLIKIKKLDELLCELYKNLSDDKIEILRQSILQQAIEGKLCEQDPNDEPASVLLEKIKAEKERLIAEKKIKKQKPLPPISAEEKPFVLPNGWTWCRLGELLTDLKYGTSVPCSYKVSGIPVLRIPNINTKSNCIDLNDLKFASLSAKEIADLSLKNHDILLVRSNGSAALVGQFALVEGDYEALCYAGYLIRIRTLHVNNKYLKIISNSRYFRQLIEVPIRTTTGVKNINASEVSRLLIALPPLQEQERIVAKFELLNTLCNKLEETVSKAYKYSSQLMEAVLQEAFSVQEAAKSAQIIEFHPDQITPETELLAAARGKIREDTWEHLCKRALEIAGEES